MAEEVVADAFVCFLKSCYFTFKNIKALVDLIRDGEARGLPAFIHIKNWVEVVFGGFFVIAISISEVDLNK